MFLDSNRRINNEITPEEDEEYDNVLDIIVKSMTDNFGEKKGGIQNEYNYALDMIQL